MKSSTKEYRYILECYDVGGTNIRGSLVNEGKLLCKYIENTIKGDAKSLIKQIKKISSLLRNKYSKDKKENIKAISIGVPGPVKKGVMYGSKPMEIEHEVNILNPMNNYFKIPVFINNDLNMATYGEMNLGQGKNTKNFCLLTLSTGIGVGIVLNGQILNRMTEIGHDIIEKDSKFINHCQGHSGCWVSQASGYGIEETLKKVGQRNTKNFYKIGIPDKIIKRIREYNAHGIGNIINAFNPEKIIVMGSLGIKLFEKIMPSENKIKNFTLIRPIPEIVPTKLDDDIGLLGAYYYGKERLNDTISQC